MSSTRKARGPVKEDASDGHEERNIWLQIRSDIERCAEVQRSQRIIGPKIKELEDEYAKTPPTAQQIGELQNLYREMVKLTNEEQSLLNEEPSNILKTLDILIALRKASTQDDHDFSRASSVPKIRKQKPPKPEPSDSAAESPGPSPSFSNARLKGNGARSTSVVSARDSKEIKIEEGAEGAKGPIAEKAGKFYVGAEVAYKQLKPKEDGSQWIICNIISIDVKGPKRKYEVQDPEPDDMGNPGERYTASATQLIAIASADADLPDYPVGKAVLARYPETTTFYRAEVTGTARKGVCKLRFEDDQNQEMEVARRFVLNLDK